MGAPNMIGDLPAIRPLLTIANGTTLQLSNPMAAGGGLFKISDNENPLPTNRVFFDFNHYENALYFSSDVTSRQYPLQTYAFGFEKTFFSEICSFGVRIPFAEGLAAVESPTENGAVTGTNFGNIPLVVKTLLHNGERHVFSGGVAVVLPSARGVNINDGALVIQNGSVHLQPFLMWLWRPRERWFVQGFWACDFDAGNSNVIADGEFLGKFQEQSLLMLDGKLGYWLYQNPDARWLTGIVPTVELHYTSTMRDAPTIVNSDGTGITPLTLRQDVLNLTAGVQLQLGQYCDLTVAGAAPLRTDPGDQLFDSEFIVQFTRRF